MTNQEYAETITERESVIDQMSDFLRQSFTSLVESEMAGMEEDMGSLPFTALDLIRQTCLSVSRFTAHELSSELIKREIRQTGESIFLKKQDLPKAIRTSLPPNIRLKDAKVKIVDESLAHLIQESHHYLGSPRNDSLNLGLFAPSTDFRGERLLAVAAFSKFDLSHMFDLIPNGIEIEQVLVLSRFYAFNGCPPNTPSFAMGRMFEWLRSSISNVKMILSYLNPNLGFNGTIYRASNWQLVGLERKERYLYLDNKYVTDRHMIDHYGTAKYPLLRKILGKRLNKSKRELMPLEVYAFTVDPQLRKQNLRLPFKDFAPNPKLV